MTAKKSKIVGDYREGSFGRMLRFRVLDRDGVTLLRNVFMSMRDSKEPMELRELPAIRLNDIRVELNVTNNPRESQVVWLAKTRMVRWVATSEEWLTNALLLDPFMQGRRGHQFLSPGARGDVQLEVSFGET